MANRREFTKPVKVEIVKRALRAGVIYCESCGCPAKVWHIDHIRPDGMETDKSRKLTAADGQLLCAGSRETCHGRKTAEQDIPAIAKAKRIEAKHLGIRKPSSFRSGAKLSPASPARRATTPVEKVFARKPMFVSEDAT